MIRAWNQLHRALLKQVATIVLISVAITPLAMAQAVVNGAIEGRVMDESGANLPGVTVTVTSPALQVPQVQVVTGSDGNYRVSQLPIGTYTVTFVLQGFQQVARPDIVLTTAFAARIDASLKVGSVAQTVEVTGASPIIDLYTSTESSTLSTEQLQSVPRGTGLDDLYALTPGVAVNGTPDVGDNELAQRLGISTYGMYAEPTLEIEGVNTQTAADSDGSIYVGGYPFQQVTVSDVGNDVEVATPGILMSGTIKSGSNNFHGSFEAGFESPSLQANNITPAYTAQGLTFTNPLNEFRDWNGDFGGRIIRDKLWFYDGETYQNVTTGLVGFAKAPAPNGLYGPGDVPGTYQTRLNTNALKIDYQISKKNKLIFAGMLGYKYQPEFQASLTKPFENTLNLVMPTGIAKFEFQRTLSSTLFLDVISGWAGYNSNMHPQASAEAAGNPTRTNVTSGLTTGPNPNPIYYHRNRSEESAYLSWLPPNQFLGGSHNFTFGTQITIQNYLSKYTANPAGDYQLVYSGTATTTSPYGNPIEITTYNHPLQTNSLMHTQAFYASDRWTIKRVTVNLGVRYERWNSFFPQTCQPAGTFVSAACYPGVDVQVWNKPFVRSGLAWDVFGTGRTLLKGSFGTYGYEMGDFYAGTYNPVSLQSTTYLWTDPTSCNCYVPGTVNLSTTGPAYVTSTGGLSAINNPNLKQPITYQAHGEIEQLVMANTSVRLMYVFDDVANQYQAVGFAPYSYPAYDVLRPYSDWNVPIVVTDPGPTGKAGGTGGVGNVTIYTYPAMYAGSKFVGNEYINSGANNDYYHSFGVTLTQRTSHRLSGLASMWITKNHVWLNPTPQNPNAAAFAINNTTTWQVRAIATYDLPHGIQLSGQLKSQNGVKGQRTVVFTGIPQAGTVTLNMEPFGSETGPAITVLAVALSKSVNWERVSWEVRGEGFNLLNSSAATAIGFQSGPNYEKPTAVLPPAIARLTVRASF